MLFNNFDISQVKRASNEHQIEHIFETLFDEANLTYQEQHRLLKGRPDSLIGDIIIDFKFNISERKLSQWVQSIGKQYLQEYYKLNGKNASLLIVISEEFIAYYDQSLVLREKREINLKSIKSLIECLLEPRMVNSEQFATLFGINSPLYILSYARLEQHFDDHSGEKTPCFSEWKKHFRLAYHDDEVGKELFLRHSYLSMLLKLILYKEFISPPQYSRDTFKDMENYFELHGISLFHYDFFRWVINVLGLCDEFFSKLKTMSFEATDIFRTIYQEMIIAGVRHKLGEYYTPEILCKKMVEKSFKVGERVLDSSCGSGTFLIECCKKIDTHFKVKHNVEPPQEWFKAVNNIIGFDINPIAVLTSKANLILYYKERKNWLQRISVNIYLCNSIEPIEFAVSGDLKLGAYYTFCVDLIGSEKNLRIPAEALQRKHIESFDKVIKTFYNVWEAFDTFDSVWEAVINALSSDIKINFLNIHAKGTAVPLGTILKDFFSELHQLKLQDKDHIWLFLLNNLVGIRSILLHRKMDLIITNPPWITYKDADERLKLNMKKISDQFDINPGSKNITNIEEAVIFLYKIPDLYLREMGKIAFVMPHSLIVSSQNEKARRFELFNNIELFEFDDLVFNIDCCCIFATYIGNDTIKIDIEEKYPIMCYFLDHETTEEIRRYSLQPFALFQPEKNSKILVKKLITPEEKETILPIYLSDYINAFIQGADLIPKSLLLCEIETVVQDGKLTVIKPWISPLAKGIWKKRHYKSVRVESENIFQTTLSRGLYPFYIEQYPTFLPLDKTFKYNPANLGPFSKKHWNNISGIFTRYNKKDLFGVGINYRNKLCVNNVVRKSQQKQIKVVFPNAKNLTSAVIHDPEGRIYIDSTLYYYGIDNENEAYYLCGMLNVRKLAETVKSIADTRHHHKRPLYFNIPYFEGNDTQIKIANLARQCEEIIQKYVSSSENPKISRIYQLIESLLKEIEEKGIEILTSEEGQKIVKEYEIGIDEK
ncbi:MAG: N-6 DNA methylase [Promethearchaeota archaeon]